MVNHVIERIPVANVDIGRPVPRNCLQPQSKWLIRVARDLEPRTQGIFDVSRQSDSVLGRLSLGLSQNPIVQIQGCLHHKSAVFDAWLTNTIGNAAPKVAFASGMMNGTQKFPSCEEQGGSTVNGVWPVKWFHASMTGDWLSGLVSDAAAFREVANLGNGTETAESAFLPYGYRCHSVSMLWCGTRMTLIPSAALTKKTKWRPTEYFR